MRVDAAASGATSLRTNDLIRLRQNFDGLAQGPSRSCPDLCSDGSDGIFWFCLAQDARSCSLAVIARTYANGRRESWSETGHSREKGRFYGITADGWVSMDVYMSP
jgi:hypothetical protein